MSIERYVEQVPQTADAVPKQLPIERGPGNFLLFQSSLANVTITLIYGGVREVFANINGGLYIRRILPWQNLRIDGPIGTSVTYFVGTEVNAKDETDIRTQVAVISGVTATADQPAATVTDTAIVPIANTGANIALFPANLSRRRIAVSVPSNAVFAANSVFFRKTGGANNLQEVQAGLTYNFSGTYGIDVVNGSALNPLNFMVFEES